jgi:hypothetical protein
MLACVSVAFTFVLVALGVVFAGVFIVKKMFKTEPEKKQ